MSRLLGVDRDAARVRVIWLRRTNSSSFNGGRMVLNNEAVEDALRNMYGAQFYAFTGSSDLHEAKRVFAHARVIVGPHGGAFTNLIFAPDRAIVIEYMPHRGDGQHYMSHGAMMMYHQASMLNQTYWRVPVVSPSSDFHIPVDGLLRLLRKIAPASGTHI